MSKVNYSIYNSFAATMQDLLPQLPRMVQDHFNHVMEDEVYGMPNAPKDGQLLKFIVNNDKEQTISPLSILVECADTSKVDTSMSIGGDTPAFDLDDSNQHLVGCDTTPGPTPKLNTLTNHHLKVLSGLNDKMRWDDQDLLNPRTVSVHTWRCKILAMLSIVPFTRNVLDRKATTFEDADLMLSSIIMCSFSNKLCTKYFMEHGDQPVPIAVDLFDWAVNKCTIHSATKEYELLAAAYAICWDQVGSQAYDFLIKWEAHVSELHAYLHDPWMPDHRYRTLKCALPSNRNTLFNLVFILHEQLHSREQTAESVTHVLCQCYELAAESAPMSLCHTTEDSELIALRAATLINCWACDDIGHAANHCPNDIAHARWKESRIKVAPKS
ncbi:uncharacterized protein UBRO_20995 [Ustilago bromivora]|uniref:CCHC-type domain-containing protein n=1 Tax=Ustilago bromivora TaxID=307758 RepID=A0A1K0HDA2_9BASI|nr:uncharacterized protein UBRO_20995 [Ustilago bromivora]